MFEVWVDVEEAMELSGTRDKLSPDLVRPSTSLHVPSIIQCSRAQNVPVQRHYRNLFNKLPLSSRVALLLISRCHPPNKQ
jgi:hypothetical protein